MILTYYNTTYNFGDALNPLIFNHFLPGFFDKNPDQLFVGIGTILGLFKGDERTQKIIVFSSGYGAGHEDIYGPAPHIDQRYDVICLRGPLTARHLRQDPSLAVSDGALLLNHMPFEPVEKQFDYAYMPHHVSESIFSGWREITEKAGFHYISPESDVSTVIEHIRKTRKVLLTETMHGAIVADVFRIPWIPVKSSAHINPFKWNDWALTLDLEIHFNRIKSLFNDKNINKILSNRFYIMRFKPLNHLTTQMYKTFKQSRREKEVIKELEKLKYKKPMLSNEKILNQKSQLLLEKIEHVKEKYKPNS